MSKIKTSQAVSIGHLDRIADYISELLLDLTFDDKYISNSYFNCFIFNNQVFITGAENSLIPINYVEVVRKAIKDITYPELRNTKDNNIELRTKIEELGYDHDSLNIKFDSISILNNVITMGRDIDINLRDNKLNNVSFSGFTSFRAFACDYTPSFTSMGYFISKEISDYLYDYRSTKYKNILPENKVTTSVKYKGDNRPESIKCILIDIALSQCDKQEELSILKNIEKDVINKFKSTWSMYSNFINKKTEIIIRKINSTNIGVSGKYTIANFFNDSNKKSFIGTVSNSQERYNSIVAEYIAKSIVIKGLARIVSVEYSIMCYADNKSNIIIDTHNTSKTNMTDIELVDYVKANFNLSTESMLEIIKFPHSKKTEYYIKS